jgi:hypothetical protein
MQAREMISQHPRVRGSVNDALIACIEECYSCSQACVSCADACLAEPSVAELTQCIRLDLDCADICAATGAIATRRTGSNEQGLRALLNTCAILCAVCAEECERHATMHQHCKVCGEQCRRCERACRNAETVVGGQASH